MALKQRTNVTLKVQPDHSTTAKIAEWDMEDSEKGALVYNIDTNQLLEWRGSNAGWVAIAEGNDLNQYLVYDPIEDKLISSKTIQVPPQSLDVGKVMTLTDTAQNMGFKNNADETKGILLGYTITDEGSQKPIYLDAGAKENDREIQILEDTTVTNTEVEFFTPGLNNGLVETYKLKITSQTAPIQFTIFQVGYDKELLDVELVASGTPDIFLAYLPSLLNIRQNENYRAVLKSDEPFTIVGTNTLAIFSPFYPYLLGDGYSYSDVEMEIFSTSQINNIAISQYDIYVDSDFTGNDSDGTLLTPYVNISDAISNSIDGSSILIQGTHIISNTITLPSDKSIYMYGNEKTIVKYIDYDSLNAEIFKQPDTSCIKTFEFHNIKFANAGGYGVYIRSAKEVMFNNCDFYNNGWSGNGLSTVLAESGSTLGYDSSQADLQAFWASSETSNGGAMRIRSTNIVSVVDCEIYNNLRGLRIQDCGIGGYGYISRNQCYNNIESGIYLASDSYDATNGCENFTVYNNASKYNANNGVLVIGGINNVVSLNIVEGNWNAGIMGWHVSNTRFRDLDLTNNNRSEFNGIGSTGDAHSSITIGGDTARSERGYIASILSCEIYNTGLGSNTSRIGFQILQDVEDIAGDYEKNLINIDDSGFHKQDYSIDVLCDLDTVKLTIGDCRYIDTIETNINIASGSYYEQPFSNHITNLKECDFSVDGESVILKEGINGVRLNPYTLHDLQANLSGSNINIMLKGSEKIQFNLDVNGVSIDGILLTGTDEEKVNELNAMLQHSGSSTGETPTITSSLAVTMEQGSTLNYELTADYGVAYEWDLSNVSGVTTVDGHTRKLIGGSSLVSGIYNIPVKAINYNGEDSEVLVLTVDAPDFSNTKSIQFQQNDFLSGAVSEVNNIFGRTSNGDGNSWTISTYFKAGSHNNSVQTIMFAGGNSASSDAAVLLYWDGNHVGRQSIGIRYGSNYNFIRKLTPQNTVSNDGSWRHIMVTFDGGTTGNQSGQLSQYYSRFKVFLDGVEQTTTNSHAAFGNAAAFDIEIFRVARWGSASSTLRNSCKVDELAFWDSDQSGNISDIYNNGSPFDLSSLTNQPLNWWRMGDDDTYPTITDNSGSTDLQMNSMTAADIVNDVP